MKKGQEQILVVERRLLDALGAFNGLCFDTATYVPVLLDKRNNRFVQRGLAENDESLKQIIPYFIIRHGDRVWCYVRGKKSGEERLVAKASIGIGGHINSADEGLFVGDFYAAAARRELEEELVLPAGYAPDLRVAALLNDESNPVGRVHLGIVHVISVPSADVRKREGLITESGFRTLPELKAMRERMETWSQICLDGIDALVAGAPP